MTDQNRNSIEPVSVDSPPAWIDVFDDSGLDYPRQVLPDSPLAEKLRALYTTPRDSAALREGMAATVESLNIHFEGIEEQSRIDEAKQVVEGLFSYLERLGKSTARKTVITYYLLGRVLNNVEGWFPSKAQYMIWVRNTFAKERHLENLRQARKLADLGEYTIKYASLGKNRCLELVYLFRQQIQEEKDRREYKGEPQMTDAEEIQLLRQLDQELVGNGFDFDAEQGPNDVDALRTHMDTVLSVYRLKEAGIDSQLISYDQVKLLALYRGLALEKKTARELKDILDTKESVEDKKLLLDDWICNRMHVPGEGIELRPMRMRSILAHFPHWLDKGREYRDHDIAMLKRNSKDSIDAVTDAYRVVMYLANALGIKDRLELPATAIDGVAARFELDNTSTPGAGT